MQFAFNKVEDAIKEAAGRANRPFRESGKNKAASDNSDLSNMSDEELQAIIAGKK
jgi:hypothetical protein